MNLDHNQMMKLTMRHVTLCMAGVITAVAVHVLASFDAGPANTVTAPPAEPAAEGERRGHAERRQWEMMRLHDPVTGVIPANIRRRELAFSSTIPTREAYDAVMGKSSATGPVASSWIHRGPYNVGGRTRALSFDMANPNVILAGGVGGGMWRSADRGQSWTRRTDPADLPSVTCIAQDVRVGKRSTFYYGTGENFGYGASRSGAGFYYGDGIFKSTDGGLTWRQLPSTITRAPNVLDNPFDIVWRIAVDPSNPLEDEVYAAVYGGIMRSVDGGASWTRVLGGEGSPSVFTDVAVTRDGAVYATLSNNNGVKGIFRSANGTDWTNITPESWPAAYRRVGIAVAPSNQNTVYFLGETPGQGLKSANPGWQDEWHSLWRYTYRSGNGSGAGGIWEDRSLNLPSEGGATGNFRSQGSYDLMITVHPQQEAVVYIGGINLYRSNNGFTSRNATTWIGGYHPANTSYNMYNNHHADQHALAFMPSDASIMVNANDGGLYWNESPMAESIEWTPLNNGYSVTQFYTVAIDQVTPGSNVIVGGTQDNGTWGNNTDDPQAEWKTLHGGDGSYCAIDSEREAYYFSSQGGSTYRYQLDAQMNYVEARRVDPLGGEGYLFVNPFALDPANRDMMYMAVGPVVYRNSGLSELPAESFERPFKNWDRLNATEVTGHTVSAIGVSSDNPIHRVYFGTSRGDVYRIDNAHQGQPVATKITGDAFPREAYVTCIAVDPKDGDRALAVFSNYNVQSLFYTENGGLTWSAVGGNLEQNPDGTGSGPSCRWATMMHRGSELIFFVGTSTGLYSTTVMSGGGTVWAQEGARSIGSVIIDMIAVRESDRLVVAATHANGVYTTNLGLTSVDDSRGIAAAALELGPNIPNPVRSTTTVELTVPGSGGEVPITVTIHDLLGRQIATAFEGALMPGRRSITMDFADIGGGRLPNGVYYYRVSAGRGTAVGKMLLAR